MIGEHQIYSIAIVMVGEFNPVIISPFWLSSKKLIREQEAHNAKVEIIHNEIVKFELEWAKIEVTKNRFEIRTSQEPFFDPVRDLAISIFEILKETPITAVGVNHLKYYAIENEKNYYRFGDNLAPLSLWREILDDPRLMFLEIVELKRKDGLNGSFRVRVKPSDIVLSTPYGILFHINDEILLQQGDGRNREIIKLLSQNWKQSIERTSQIVSYILTKNLQV